MSRRKGPREPVFDSRDSLLDASVDGELDLHGYSAAEAPSALRRFLQTWQRRNRAMVGEWRLDDGEGGYRVRLTS